MAYRSTQSPTSRKLNFWYALPSGVRGAIITLPLLTFVYLLNFWVLNGRVFARSFGDLDVTVYIWNGWWLQMAVYGCCGLFSAWQGDSHGMLGVLRRRGQMAGRVGVAGTYHPAYGVQAIIGGVLLGVAESIFYLSSGAISGAEGAPWVELITPAIVFFVFLDFCLCIILAGLGSLIYSRFLKTLR